MFVILKTMRKKCKNVLSKLTLINDFFTIAKSQNNCSSFVFDAKHRQLFDTIVAKCEKHSKNHDNIYCDDFENC